MTYTITLADGTSRSFTTKRPVRHYGSWLMQQMPYGTDFFGATFSRKAN